MSVMMLQIETESPKLFHMLLQTITMSLVVPAIAVLRCVRRPWSMRWCQRRSMSANRNILTLHERGLFQTIFPEDRSSDLYRELTSGPQCVYCGFDPTADSLHVGNLLAVIALLHCQRAGHKVVALLGSATAQIGDPSGKSKERPVMDPQTVQQNADSIAESLHRVFTNHSQFFCKSSEGLPPARILDNTEWYKEKNVIQFLSSVGRYFRMGTLLGRDSVKSRLSSAEGMSLTEFTYQVFQSYDWLHLYREHQCLVQIGGNDQMGNMMSGHDLIQRVFNKPVFALTVPLITSTAGDKLGKTAGNAVWLNPDRTSIFEFYQYFLRLADTEVEKLLRLFTFLPLSDISDIMARHRLNPSARKAQKLLAENVTKLVHGELGVASAQRTSAALYGSSPQHLASLSEHEMQELFTSAASCELLLEPGTSLLDAVMRAKCFSRTVDGERVIRQGGVSINHQRITNPDAVLIPGQHILPNNISLVKVGKKHIYLIKWRGLTS